MQQTTQIGITCADVGLCQSHHHTDSITLLSITPHRTLDATRMSPCTLVLTERLAQKRLNIRLAYLSFAGSDIFPIAKTQNVSRYLYLLIPGTPNARASLSLIHLEVVAYILTCIPQ